MSSLKLNTSWKHHLITAFITAIWLVVFLVFIAPFDIAELPFNIRLQIMPLYGIISFIGYLILIPLQNWVLKKLKQWTVVLESLIIILFNVLVLLGSYIYYTSDIINGAYSFIQFTFEVYYPIFLFLLPIIIFARWFLNKKVVNHNSEKIILTGENKLDILQIKSSDLICITSADNYVEVAYLINNILNKKLLRTTLKNMHSQLPELVKVHRSHLINPIHFKEWKTANVLLLTQMEVPISKNYKQNIMALDHSPLKSNSLSQTQ